MAVSDGLNESQRKIAERLDGMMVVDAGPGTGKTHTIVRRYLNIVGQKDVSPKDVLVLTFTNNAAAELEQRIKNAMIAAGMGDKAKLVQARTFDSFCLSIVMDTPEDAGKLFGIDERLSRGASMVNNETLEKDRFRRYLDHFLLERGEDYGDWGAIASQNTDSLRRLINNLMARGVFPLKTGWFGMDWEKQIFGDRDGIKKILDTYNSPRPKSCSVMSKDIKELASDRNYFKVPVVTENTVPEEIIDCIINDPGREEMIRMVHDIYRGYIRASIAEDRLTFGINASLAFALLYGDKEIRLRNSFRYVMIDEFQDTNANQLMIALMILSAPNLCVVGDWKQGIYGFRYVSIENITEFESRSVQIRRFLNDDDTRVRISIGEVVELSLDVNYRSSETVVDWAFRAIRTPGKKDDQSLDQEYLDRHVVSISAALGDILNLDTSVRYVQCKSKDEEAEIVSRCVREYVHSDDYSVVSGDGSRRPMRYGDIAVLCRKTSSCRTVLERLQADGIPVFLQGDVDIMSTREGKLALAWLRYVNNERDRWGYEPIMADLGYSLADCTAAKNDPAKVPSDIVIQRADLYLKRRRVTELLTSIFAFHGLDNDVTQAIITVLSEAHRGSLLSISDLILIIEDGIENSTVYPVENSVETDAVRIMTMHQSKGLEFPAVILPYIDDKTMPSTRKDDRRGFFYNEKTGIRCSYEVGRFDGYVRMCTSWKTAMISKSIPSDYNEERRLMFVAMSRAKQYETLIAAVPSRFFKELSEGSTSPIPDIPMRTLETGDGSVQAPDVSGYDRRTRHLGVHTLMFFYGEDGTGGMSEGDEVGGKGKDYGDKVHKAAEALFQGYTVTETYPELDEIRRILDRVDGSDTFSELACILPVPGANVVLSGRIDLLAIYDDRIEVHDYKTDVTNRFESEYEFQLSVYANAAKDYYGKPVVCFIDYVSQGRSKEFEPMSMEVLTEEVCRRMALANSQTYADTTLTD